MRGSPDHARTYQIFDFLETMLEEHVFEIDHRTSTPLLFMESPEGLVAVLDHLN